ncbi:DEAD/DEAH box helicase [Marininema halotolerans]|uniref:Helicase conserved C-terminal domain-containing protein n=1 Tax=Marininema halotolerans TaxID=1155944 RepID=A0A1I6R3I9_9BACL|nr:SNF2-related protein [Marininema halotolerans]SFS59058.1 Helicase conserved C-terminal domain-containing protein [Marininema halotolerans]
MESLPIRVDRTWLNDFLKNMEQESGWSTWERYRLALEAAELQCIPDFDTLRCLEYVTGFEPLPHQIETAQKVLGQMKGRAILADEVGLGKTIEAGLILKEYMVRGLVKNALILVPSSLVLQWTRELNQKFQIPATPQKKEWMWDQYDILVASIDTAKRDPHRSKVLNRHYDLLIVDEAHKLKNRRTKNWQFINEMKKKYTLLLTATPIQNDLHELYNLVTLLKPGQLGQQTSFNTTYVAGKRKPKNEDQLREEVHRVMIRNKRSDGHISFTKRHVHTVRVTLSPEERALYEGITQFIREQYQSNRGQLKSLLSLITLQREVCSSRDAAFHTLFKLFKRESDGLESLSPEVLHLAGLLRAVQTQSKVNEALRLVKEINDKVIIFTEYRATQDLLIRALNEHNIYAVPYRGGFARNKKDWMREIFQTRAQVMVATEAGGEGINLQFCHHIINYDLPWNPMRVEQRIGRIHRLGQSEDVTIFNFATENTIEEHIVWLLHEKIDMFRTVIGEVDTILEKMGLKEDVEQNLMRILIESKDDQEIQVQLDKLGDQFASAEEQVRTEIEKREVLMDGTQSS